MTKGIVGKSMTNTFHELFRTLWIDVLATFYAIRIYMENVDKLDRVRLFFLCVAKYHGLAVSLSLLAAHWTVCYSLHELLRSLLSRCCIAMSCMNRSSVSIVKQQSYHPRRQSCHSHVLYAFRFICSAAIHAMVHVSFTHSIGSIVRSVSYFEAVQLWSVYRWTLTGYALSFSAFGLLLSGCRLLRFIEHHVSLRNIHVTLYVTVLLGFTVHSSNYPMLVVSLALPVLEWSCSWLRSMHLVTVDSLTIFRESKRTNDVIVELNFTCDSMAGKFRCGDHVRVYVPAVSLFQLHTFALIPFVDNSKRRVCFRVLIRTVGEWTKRLYAIDRTKLGRLWIFGPFQNRSEVELDRLLPLEILSTSRANRNRCVASLRRCFRTSRDTVDDRAAAYRSSDCFTDIVIRPVNLANGNNNETYNNDEYNSDAYDLFPLSEISSLRDFNVNDDSIPCPNDDVSIVDERSSVAWVDPNLRLCLICTGISITRHLAILTHLVTYYRSLRLSSVGVRNEQICCCESIARQLYSNDVVATRIRLPFRIKLVWSIARLFEVNLAVRTLDDLQRQLTSCGWQSLLTYDIFVTRTPSPHDRIVNERFQSFLWTDSNANGRGCRYQCDDGPSNEFDAYREDWITRDTPLKESRQQLRYESRVPINSYANLILSDLWRRTKLFDSDDFGSEIDTRQQSVDTRKQIVSSTAVRNSRKFFSKFYEAAHLTSGKRVNDWDRVILRDGRTDTIVDGVESGNGFGSSNGFGNSNVRIESSNDADTIRHDYRRSVNDFLTMSLTETIVVLTTGVKAMQQQVENLVDRYDNVKLHVEQLW